MPKCGGLSEIRVITDEIEEHTISLKKEIEEKEGVNFSVFSPLTYRSQVVAGINYFVLVGIEHNNKQNNLHVRIYVDLKGKPHLHSYKYPKKIEDKLEYF